MSEISSYTRRPSVNEPYNMHELFFFVFFIKFDKNYKCGTTLTAKKYECKTKTR
jgi:hypothetical protein